ncbi:hypothetical protein PENANT_c003G11109 [Penicillium antarcticum]|uniref:Uncharacterized protein n=1 Tax=Penicillium antarcticum TaxID=416450 RepID=A0A1V6QIN1_9EURO|nr:uncharacterized protein N7508_006011 [Penicillium antarcticum]KAJ5306996.1 hypothetical protein N7508_006011 [Penicillium antarcticum]OQD89070.1 hypothetical protein PENANT_c003G11109 [Penicillium antarcticum]
MLTATLFSLFLLAGAQPLAQSLTVEPVKDCSELPNYNPKARIAGPWTINVDGCRNGTSSHCSIERFSTSADTTRQFGDEGFLNGLITITSQKENIKTQLRCNGNEGINQIEAHIPYGSGDLAWHPVGINHHPATGRLVWGREFEPVQFYRHSVQGARAEGIFLGSNGQTQWFIHSSGPDVSFVDYKPYWIPRLVIPDMVMNAQESKAFMRIDGS